ncbi:hypothetical protein OAQ99_05100, partial [Candidatus Kapabacteria bacterium]|nr:hypothetical protein [Candidatus Kapabacteria bacterium]
GKGEDFIKKSERTKENGLGNHGVRKYDHLIGQFNSLDPLIHYNILQTIYKICINCFLVFGIYLLSLCPKKVAHT